MACLGLIGSVGGAILAPATASSVQVDRPQEIVVTGERRPRSLRETASSVVVITAPEIEALAVDRVDQLLATVPNVQFGSGTEGVAIRGQDTTGVVRELFAFLGGIRPRTTLTVDGRGVGYYEYVLGATSVWDVDTVEVFRSPQTTTQGRNSIAGAIFINTSDPTYKIKAHGRAILGNLGTRQASAVLSGPIIPGQLAIRVSGDLKLGHNSSEMADGIPGANIDRDDHGVARIKLLAEPAGLPGMRVEASYVHSKSQAPQFEAVRAPFEERRSPQFERTNGINKIRTDSATGLLSYQLLPSLTSRTTLSYGGSLVQRFGLPGLGRTRVNASDFSAETVVQWEPKGPLRMLGGIHYLSVDQRQSIDITGLGIGTGSFTDEQRSLGLFGEATWRPVERLAIVAGVRCQRDQQDRRGQVGPVGPGITVAYDQRFDACLPKLSVSYDLPAGTTVGLLAQRAYNPGGTTVSLATRRQDNFDEERLSNYEAFGRSSFAGGRGTMAVNLFYSAIEDAQRPQVIEFIAPDGKPFTATEIDNAPSARSYGMEVELGWRASSRLSMRVGAAHLNTKIRRTRAASDPILGKAFQRSPAFSAAVAVDWRPVDPLRLSAQLRTTSDYFSDDANTPFRRISGPTTLNARAAYTAGSATVFGYVKNALNAFYLTYLFTPTFGTAGDPREVGLGVDARF